MAKKKKRRTALPRVTVLAMTRGELTAFVTAVQTLGHIVGDLRAIAADLAAARPKRRRPPAVSLGSCRDPEYDPVVSNHGGEE